MMLGQIYGRDGKGIREKGGEDIMLRKIYIKGINLSGMKLQDK
jgi:hypothetical protein